MEWFNWVHIKNGPFDAADFEAWYQCLVRSWNLADGMSDATNCQAQVS